MRALANGAIAATGALLLALGTAALSHVPFTPDPGARAALRISWRARGERIERCRRLSATELEAIPAHMRQETVCEGGAAPYRLRVVVDDTLRVDAIVHGAGARRDRPLYVFHEIPLAPGVHDIRVAFAISDTAGAGHDEAEEHQERAGRATDATPGRQRSRDDDGDDERSALDAARHIQHADAEEVVPRLLTLSETVTLAPNALALVTYLPERRRLELLTREADAP